MRLFNAEKNIAVDVDILGGDPISSEVPMFARFSLANGGDYYTPQFLGASRQEIEAKVAQWALQEGFTNTRPLGFKGLP